jgi:hypothetical protein
MLGGGIRSWKFISFNIFFLPKRKAKDANAVMVTLRTRIHVDMSYIDPPLRVLNFFSK